MDIDWNSAELDPHIRERLEKELSDPKVSQAGKTTIERPAGIYDKDAEPEGVVSNPNDLSSTYHTSSIILVKEVGTHLNKHYPGWAWMVQLNEFGHMIEILNHHLHPTMGYRIRMEDIMYDPHRRVLKVAGGEILERFGMKRKGLTGENKQLLADAPRDAVGNCIPEISDLPDKKAATQADIARKIHNGDIRIFEVNGQKMVRIKK